MGVVRGVARALDVANRVLPDEVKRAAADEVMKVARQVAPTPEELAAGVEKAADALREKAPAAMGRVSTIAGSAMGVARAYVPGVVSRATAIVDAARETAAASAPDGAAGAGDAARTTSSTSSRPARDAGGAGREARR